MHTPVPGFAHWLQEQGQALLDEAIKIAQESTEVGGPAQVNREIVVSPPVPALVDLSKGADMVVVGRHGRSALAGHLLGSMSSGLIHHSHCPVAVIRDEGPLVPHPEQAPVLVGIDGSPTSELATAIAFDEASRRGVELVAVHAWSDIGVGDFPGVEWSIMEAAAEETLAQRLAGWQERYPAIKVRRIVVCDESARHVVKQSESAQLVVVGSHGRGGFVGMLLGSVSSAVVQASRVPVIVARRS